MMARENISTEGEKAGRVKKVKAGSLPRLLQSAVQAAGEAILLADRQGLICYVNKAFERLTGYSQAEALKQNPRLLSSGLQTKAFYRDLWGTLASGRAWQGELINRKKNGALYTQRTSISPLGDGSGAITHYLSIASDISIEKKIEEQFFQEVKMDSLARLAGGIAHDFNNLLTIINGYAEMVLAESPGGRIRENVQSIYNAGEKAARLISHILAFSRKQIINPRVWNVNGAVRELQQMIRGILGEGVALEIDLAADAAPVRIDQAQLEQIIMNLVVNASDAMQSGGRLLLRSENFSMDDDFVSRHLGAKKGDYVKLEIADTGRGMAPEVQQHIFEPFFTTKRLGEGSGLGLASVYGIVKQNKGYVTFASELGQGTHFSIYIPKHDFRELDEAGDNTAEKKPLFAGRTVLLIEADDTVRKLTEKVLLSAGFQVLESMNWSLAKRLAKKMGQAIDLLLADVLGPEMPGREAAEKILAAHPEARILLTSGYMEKHVFLPGVLDHHIDFISKPFNRQELLEKIGEILDKKD